MLKNAVLPMSLQSYLQPFKLHFVLKMNCAFPMRRLWQFDSWSETFENKGRRSKQKGQAQVMNFCFRFRSLSKNVINLKDSQGSGA